MAELKTKATDASVEGFLMSVRNDKQRDDCRALIAMMRSVTRAEPRMWGRNMVGFGEYSYKYASGHGGTWFLTGFAPRANEITVYVLGGLDRYQELLSKLGKHSNRKSCLYIKRLDDVNRKVLRQLIAAGVKDLKARVAAETRTPKRRAPSRSARAHGSPASARPRRRS